MLHTVYDYVRKIEFFQFPIQFSFLLKVGNIRTSGAIRYKVDYLFRLMSKSKLRNKCWKVLYSIQYTNMHVLRITTAWFSLLYVRV